MNSDNKQANEEWITGGLFADFLNKNQNNELKLYQKIDLACKKFNLNIIANIWDDKKTEDAHATFKKKC